MAREFFKDLPNTTTPLTAERLNGLLNGKEAMGTIVVDDITNKNLFNINGEVNVQANNGAIVSRNTVSNNVLTANANMSSVYPSGQKITGLTSKTVTFSAKVVSLGTGQDGRIYIYDNYVQKQAVAGTSDETISITYTCESDNILFVFGTGSGTGAQFTNIQVELGEEKTDYVKYKQFGIQSGSNSYGEWIKFDDGTMICYRTYNTNVNITTEWGSLYVGEIPATINYSQTFISTPTVIYDVQPTTNTGCFNAHYNRLIIGTSGFSGIAVARPTSASTVNVNVVFIAIGKWK